MSSFRQKDDSFINSGSIKAIHHIGGGRAQLVYTDNSTEEIDAYLTDDMIGSNRIVQVVPVAVPTVAIYEDDSGRPYETDIYYLGLTEFGDLRPLELVDEHYEFVDDLDSMKRLEHRKVE